MLARDDSEVRTQTVGYFLCCHESIHYSRRVNDHVCEAYAINIGLFRK